MENIILKKIESIYILMEVTVIKMKFRQVTDIKWKTNSFKELNVGYRNEKQIETILTKMVK